ncbi:MAG TPA: guanylate kinase [Longimicrobiales bacterium]|nr:guanylate kinase [Longimicrobiales bacterium]
MTGKGRPETRRARPVVLAAPSGTGKTTLARRLVERSPDYVFSVSATTRPPRPGEVDGRDYRFVDRATFEAMIEAGELAEWAEVHGRLYGTPKDELEAAAERGLHAVLDIDVQGARQIARTVPEARRIFVLPPDVGTLLARLRGRGTEDAAGVARRLRTALEELQAVGEFDYVVVNDDLERCLEAIRGIVSGEEEGIRPAALEERVQAMRAEIGRILAQEYAEQANAHP